MIKSYGLLQTLAGIGALWIILVIFFYPKPDQIVSIADVLFQAKHGEIFEIGFQNDAKFDPELESAKFVESLMNENNEIQKIEVKSRKATKPRSNKFKFTKPPNIFNTDNVGEFGLAMKMPKHLPKHIKKLYDDGWRQHEFNQYLSDLISVRRNLLDSRSVHCKAAVSNYSRNLPSTSVIVIFHNEAWSTLLRTVHSVLDRSPEHLIEEILLVDDFSDLGEICGA